MHPASAFGYSCLTGLTCAYSCLWACADLIVVISSMVSASLYCDHLPALQHSCWFQGRAASRRPSSTALLRQRQLERTSIIAHGTIKPTACDTWHHFYGELGFYALKHGPCIVRKVRTSSIPSAPFRRKGRLCDSGTPAAAGRLPNTTALGHIGSAPP